MSVEAVAALAVRGVSHAYGSRQALCDVSLTVPQSRFTALLGLNGAGKTTLFSLITRLYDTRHGSIDVLGHRVSREPGRALRLLGVVFQARTLDLDISVMDNLLYHAALHGIGSREARQRALARCKDRTDRPLQGRSAQAVRRTDAQDRDRTRTVASAACAGAGRTDGRSGRCVPLRHPASCAFPRPRPRRCGAMGDPSPRRGRERRCGRRAASRAGTRGSRRLWHRQAPICAALSIASLTGGAAEAQVSIVEPGAGELCARQYLIVCAALPGVRRCGSCINAGASSRR